MTYTYIILCKFYCIAVFIYVRDCISVHTYVRTCVRACGRTYVRNTYIHTGRHTYFQTDRQMDRQIQTYGQTHMCTHVRACVIMYVCLRACVRMCVYVGVCLLANLPAYLPTLFQWSSANTGSSHQNIFWIGSCLTIECSSNYHVFICSPNLGGVFVYDMSFTPHFQYDLIMF